MVFSRVKTFYLSRSGQGDNEGLVRYDAITISDDEYLINVLHNHPTEGAQVMEFSYKRDEYNEKHNIGKNMIRDVMPPTFDDAMIERCAKHRDSLK